MLIIANGVCELLHGYRVHSTIDDYGRSTLALVLTRSSDQAVMVYELMKQKLLMQPTKGVDLESVAVKSGKVSLTLN